MTPILVDPSNLGRCPMCRREGVALLDSHIWPQALARKIKREGGSDRTSSSIIIFAAGPNAPDPKKFGWVQDVPHERMLCAECERYSDLIENPALRTLRRDILP